MPQINLMKGKQTIIQHDHRRCFRASGSLNFFVFIYWLVSTAININYLANERGTFLHYVNYMFSRPAALCLIYIYETPLTRGEPLNGDDLKIHLSIIFTSHTIINELNKISIFVRWIDNFIRGIFERALNNNWTWTASWQHAETSSRSNVSWLAETSSDADVGWTTSLNLRGMTVAITWELTWRTALLKFLVGEDARSSCKWSWKLNVRFMQFHQNSLGQSTGKMQLSFILT